MNVVTGYRAPLILLCAACFVLQPVPGDGFADDRVSTTEASDFRQSSNVSRFWMRTLDTAAGPRAALKVRFADEQPADGPLVFDAEILSESDNGGVIVALHVFDEFDQPLHFASVDLRADEGLRTCRFLWEKPEVADGSYRVNVDVIRSGSGFVMASAVLSLVRLSSATVYAELDSAKSSLAYLQAHLETHGVSLGDRPLLRGKLALARDTLNALPADESDWRRIQHAARFASRQVDYVRARMTFTDAPATIAPVSDTSISIRGGQFVQADEPQVLVGVYGPANEESIAERLHEYGLNFAAIEEPRGPAPGADAGILLEALARNGAAAIYLHDGATRKYEAAPPVPLDSDSYSVQDALGESFAGLDATVSRLRSHPNLLGVSLTTGPHFMFTGDPVADGFVSWLKDHYKDRNRLNRAWRTRFFEFDEVKPWWDLSRAPYQYDWQRFHRSLATDYFTQLVQGARKNAVGTAMFATLEGDFFTAGESRYGIAREPLTNLFSMHAFRYSGTRDDPLYARAYPAELPEIVLRRSLQHNEPVIELGDYRLFGDDLLDTSLFAFTRSLVWDAAVEGANAVAFRGWSKANEARYLLDQPDALDGLLTSKFELNRHAEIIAAFQQEPARVAILLSDSSKIYKDGGTHLDSVLKAYEGCSFSGMKIRFLTEAQLEAGELNGVQAIVLPDTPALRDEAFAALRDLAETNMVFVRSGTTIPYDGWGRSRLDSIAFSVDTFAAYEDTSAEYMQSMEAAIVTGRLPEVPRAVNRFGYTVEGVRARSVVVDGQTYVYLMNLRDEPTAVYLAGVHESGFDLVRDRPARFPMELNSLEPYLIRMDVPQASPEALAMDALEPADSPDVPTALVRPYDETEPEAAESR